MINLLLSIAAGVLTAVLLRACGFSWVADLLPGVLVMAGTFVVLARRIAGKVQKLGEQAQTLLQQVRTEKERVTALDRAIKVLEGGFAYQRWQFLIAAEIHANVGMLLYMKKDFAGAKPHLEQAFSRNWMAWTMLGCLRFMEKNEPEMVAAFEKSVGSGGKKESMAWAVYAWCLWRLDKKDQALAVLSKATTENPSDEKLKKSLMALQNGKKLKMSAYEPMWWQFQLEKPPMEAMGQPRVRFQRGRR